MGKLTESIEYENGGVKFKDIVTLKRVYKYWQYNTNEIIVPREMFDIMIYDKETNQLAQGRTNDIFYLMLYNAYLQWFGINNFFYGMSYDKNEYDKLKSNIIFSDDLDLLLYKSSKLSYHLTNRRFSKMEYKYEYIKKHIEFLENAYITLNAVEFNKRRKSFKIFDYFKIERHPKRKIFVVKYRFNDIIMDYLFYSPDNKVKFNFKEYITVGNRVTKHVYGLLYGKYPDKVRVTVDIKKSFKIFNVSDKTRLGYYFLLNKYIIAFRELRQVLKRIVWGHFLKLKKSNGKYWYLFEIEKLSKNELDKIEEYKKEFEKYMKKEMNKIDELKIN